MKGFMQWFKSSSKMKRWIFLILVGIFLTCYGLAKILVMKEISFQEVAKVIVIFILGFISIVLGLIFFHKRTLEILIEATDDRMENKKNINMKSLIFDKTIYDQGPNIVVIGGGTGINTVLSGLKNYTSNLTAIVTISDYGEESDSRRELGLLPLEEVKDSIIALSSKQEPVKKLFNYTFTNGKLRGLKFSDIYFSAMNAVNQDVTNSIRKSNEVINMVGKVIPVTVDEMNIIAELANGYIVEEKAKIPEVVSEKLTKIHRILLNPSNCRPAEGVIEAIKNADCIIIGPGSLYTNVIPNLLVNGVAKAIKESVAIKVYMSNIMTDPGQTDNYSVSDHLNAIIEHCGSGLIDYCIYDTGEVVPEFIKKYNREGQDLVDQNIDKVKGIKFLQRNLSIILDGHIRHDPNLVASSIIELICDDLKYQDKQNDPQYLMLSNKLKQEKRIEKIKKAMAKKSQKPQKENSNSLKSKSKFSNKYHERINSIREADEKAKLKSQKEQERRQKRIEEKRRRMELERRKQIELEKRKRLEQEKLKNAETEEKTTQAIKKTRTVTSKNTETTKSNAKPKSARGLKKGTKKKEE